MTLLPYRTLVRVPRKIVVALFGLATSGYRVRLDFHDGESIFIGPASAPTVAAIVPTPFWRTLWMFTNPGLRVGEEFVRGGWRIKEGDLANFIRVLLLPRASKYARLYNWLSDRRGPIFYVRQRVFTKWNRRKGSLHYDVGRELYERMLDPSMQYSCAFYSLTMLSDLKSAQKAKLKATVDRLHLDRPNFRVLDIGSGWGALAVAIAEHAGAHSVVGITLSHDQHDGAVRLRENLTPDVRGRLEFRLEDYTSYLAAGASRFDRIVSIGMLEHVGLGQHVHFFHTVRRSLAAGGRALIHSIVRPAPGAYNEWIRRNIFPGSFLPSLAEMVSGAESAGLVVDAVHVHPPSDYGLTLRAWRQQLENAWADLHRAVPFRYDETFRKKWIFYLSSMEAIFNEDTLNFRIAQLELRSPPA